MLILEVDNSDISTGFKHSACSSALSLSTNNCNVYSSGERSAQMYFLYQIFKTYRSTSEIECFALNRDVGKMNSMQESTWSQLNLNEYGYTFELNIEFSVQNGKWSIFLRINASLTMQLKANTKFESVHKEILCQMKFTVIDITNYKQFWTNEDIVQDVIARFEKTSASLECPFSRFAAKCLNKSQKIQNMSCLTSRLNRIEASNVKNLSLHRYDDAESIRTRFLKKLFLCAHSQKTIERRDKTTHCLENYFPRVLEIAAECLNQSCLVKRFSFLPSEAKRKESSNTKTHILHIHDDANIMQTKFARKIFKYVHLQSVIKSHEAWSCLENPFSECLLVAAEFLNHCQQMKHFSLLAIGTKQKSTEMKSLFLHTSTDAKCFMETVFISKCFALIHLQKYDIFCHLSSLQRIFQNYIMKQISKLSCKENVPLKNAFKGGNQTIKPKGVKLKEIYCLGSSTINTKHEKYEDLLKTMTSTFFLDIDIKDSKHDKYMKNHNEWHNLEVVSEAFVYPVFRNNLEYSFEQILNGTPYFSSEVMRFEHHRLGTFANYSYIHAPSALLMAKSGWYATGNANETKTFCCQQTNSVWSKQDNPFVVHKELSPSCAFINGSDLGQVSIQDDTSEGNISEGIISQVSNGLQNTHIESLLSDVENTFETSQNDQSGLRGAHTQGKKLREQSSNTLITSASLSIDCPSRLSSARTFRTHSRDISSADSDSRFSGINNQAESVQTEKSRTITTSTKGITHSERVYQQFILPPLILKDPKHMEYSTVGVRASSFSGFPIGSGKTPKEFAVGGFYYKGFGDRTSCFHCGVTLQGWSLEDDVLVEHVRYNPLCEYIRRLKGDDFVKLVMSASQNPQCIASQSESNEDHCRLSTFDMKSKEDVISKLKEMGFTQNSISSALGKVRNNNEQVTVQRVLDAITEDTSNEEITTQNDSAGNLINTPNVELGACLNTGSTNQFESIASGLSQEHSMKSFTSEFKDQFLCKICMDERVGVVFTPCGHIVTCSECSRSVRKCPICRETIRDKIRTIINE